MSLASYTSRVVFLALLCIGSALQGQGYETVEPVEIERIGITVDVSGEAGAAARSAIESVVHRVLEESSLTLVPSEEVKYKDPVLRVSLSTVKVGGSKYGTVALLRIQLLTNVALERSSERFLLQNDRVIVWQRTLHFGIEGKVRTEIKRVLGHYLVEFVDDVNLANGGTRQLKDLKEWKASKQNQ